MTDRVEIIIDELVLDGFDPADRYAIGEALAAELSRLGGRSASHLTGGRFDSLDAGRVTLQPNARPAAVGAQVGRAVLTSLSAQTTNEARS